MPAIERLIREDKERIGVVLKELRNQGALLPHQQLVRRESRVNDVETVTPGRKQNGVRRQRICCRRIPAPAGVEFRPKELLERLRTAKILENVQHDLLAFGSSHSSSSLELSDIGGYLPACVCPPPCPPAGEGNPRQNSTRCSSSPQARDQIKLGSALVKTGLGRSPQRDCCRFSESSLWSFAPQSLVVAPSCVEPLASAGESQTRAPAGVYSWGVRVAMLPNTHP